MPDLLLEIGLEEVPARMLASAEAELAKRTLALLERERLVQPGAATRTFSTPRRLAVLISDVAPTQADVTEELLGPSAKIAFKDGAPGPAAIAFAKKAGIAVESLRTVTTPKGEYIAATSTRPGRTAAEVLAAELPKELAGIYWAKNMYWRPGKPERFVRPVRWLLCLLGSEIVPVSFGGKTAANLTYGHRVLHGDAPITVAAPADYQTALEAAHVLPDVEARRHKIRKALDRVCRTVPNARWREDHALVDKLTHLTEWPSVIAGSFEREYLALPEEVLVTVMRDHQNEFAVEDSAGALAPHFLAVLNTETDSAGEAIIRHGNERVLRARFNDARFFWEFDQRTPLADRLALLEKVTFQKDLGSYAVKTERIRNVARVLAAKVGSAVDAVALDEAARLSKTDLTTDLVKEFTELQGEIGGLYARHQGLTAATADAIYDHYRPTSMDDRIPRTPEGQLLALADKADTIAGMFSLGLEPTGSKDPFALRRAANGIVKILAEADPALPLALGDIANAAIPAPESQTDEPLRRRVEVFLAERLEFYLREAKGQAYDVVAAVLAAGANDVRDAISRAEAITAVRGSQDFASVSAAFKRIGNILAQATEKGIAFGSVPDRADLTTPAEKDLFARVHEIQRNSALKLQQKDYIGVLEAIATLRPNLNLFFDEVLVMDPDEGIRKTRLTLLHWVQLSFRYIADFSEIVITG
jgi:glycyl-tRNA synthetase beta chain